MCTRLQTSIHCYMCDSVVPDRLPLFALGLVCWCLIAGPEVSAEMFAPFDRSAVGAPAEFEPAYLVGW